MLQLLYNVIFHHCCPKVEYFEVICKIIEVKLLEIIYIQFIGRCCLCHNKILFILGFWTVSYPSGVIECKNYPRLEPIYLF